MSDTEEIYEVRGHLCDGLRKHLAYSTYRCIPRISEEGWIHGCDDSNMIPILFCPWCGEELPDPPPEEKD